MRAMMADAREARQISYRYVMLDGPTLSSEGLASEGLASTGPAPAGPANAGLAGAGSAGGGPAGEPAALTEALTDGLPPAYVDCLLDSALEPLLDAAVRRGEQAAKRKQNAGAATRIAAAEVARALLALTVCDPACGSGDLLVAAARRIAGRLAQARAGNQSP